MPSRIGCLLLLLSAVAPVSPALAAGREAILLRTTGPRQAMRTAVEALGGTVDVEFQNVNAVAATVPAGTMALLGAMPDFKVTKDELVAPPSPHDPSGESSGAVEAGAADGALDTSALAGALPGDYRFNNTLIRANVVQASGNLGQGVIVAIIDSGTANNPAKVAAIAGSVIGGQSFVPAAADPIASATSTKNGLHGTWVGSMIAGHVTWIFSNASCLSIAGRRYAPDSFIDGTPYGFAGYTLIPMTGVAPGAKLYALKVFRSAGGSSPTSWILAAMDRALTQKKNFLAGIPSVPVSGTGAEDDPFVYDSLDIQVVNMSLGGGTVIAGRDLEDQLLSQMVAAGMTVAASAGNAGPSGLTTGSPSTSLASVSSAAASTPAHERIVRSLAASGSSVCRPNRGILFRPSDAIQTALFSSRGPTADGRVGVSVSTAGDFNFAQGADGYLYFVSGTSFAAPTVAGAAALLRKGVPGATAAQVRNALIAGANPNVLGDGSTSFDQGAGFLDVAASLDLLKKGRVSGAIRGNRFEDEVEENIERVGLHTRELSPGHSFRAQTGMLLPGERREYYVEVDRDVGSLRIDVLGVAPELPPASQNQLFGDDLIVQFQNAKTSTDDVPYFNFVAGPDSATIGNLDTGIARLTFVGDWTNAGRASGVVQVTALPRAGAPTLATSGVIADGDWVAVPVTIPDGTVSARFEVSWKGDWGHYPTNDIDLYVVDPAGKANLDGATFNSPERATLVKPKAGDYTVLINGYTVFGPMDGDDEGGPRGAKTDRYTLRVFLE